MWHSKCTAGGQDSVMCVHMSVYAYGCAFAIAVGIFACVHLPANRTIKENILIYGKEKLHNHAGVKIHAQYINYSYSYKLR